MSSLLGTLVELQRLKRLERTGWNLRGLPNGTESVAAHSFGVSIVAMLLADELMSKGIELDTEKILRTALIHDWAEVRVGDLPRTATSYFGADLRKRAETAAFADVISKLDGSARYLELYEAYEQRGSIEAKIVKAADIVDLLVQVLALERAGARGLEEFWEVAEEADFQLQGEAKETIDRLLQALCDERKRMLVAREQ